MHVEAEKYSSQISLHRKYGMMITVRYHRFMGLVAIASSGEKILAEGGAHSQKKRIAREVGVSLQSDLLPRLPTFFISAGTGLTTKSFKNHEKRVTQANAKGARSSSIAPYKTRSLSFFLPYFVAPSKCP